MTRHPLKNSLALLIALTTFVTVGNAESRLITNLQSGNEQVVVAYGTSLTANGAWVGQLEAAIEAQFPEKCTLINSGGAGKNSQWGLEQLERRVLQHKPDSVFIEFSMNDAVARFDISVEAARKNLETMIERILKTNSDCEVILMTMTTGNKYPEEHRSYRKDIEAHYEMYRSVAKERELLLIDHYPQWKALQANDPKLFSKYVPDTIHAKELGYSEVVTPVILKAIGLHTTQTQN